MKKIFNLSLLLFAVVALTVTLNRCNKNYNDKQMATPTVSNNPADNSQAVTEHILAFKSKMEYYRKHPGLKSGEKKQTDSTVLDWESTINLTYCYNYLELSDTKVFDTIIALPPINNDYMLMTDISDKYYNEIVYAVQSQYFQTPFPDSLKKLMAVDLEKTSGGDSLHIKSMIGNTMTMAHQPFDWKYGDYLGTCDGQHDVGVSDAAHIIADNTRNHFYEEPPAGCRWYFYGPITTINANDPTEYTNPNDPDPVNYEDYLIYYANSSVGPITNDVLCLEYYDELAFYKQSYINITEDSINSSGGKKFMDCDYTGMEYTYFGNDIYKHTLITLLGYRGIVCDISIDDISQY